MSWGYGPDTSASSNHDYDESADADETTESYPAVESTGESDEAEPRKDPSADVGKAAVALWDADALTPSTNAPEQFTDPLSKLYDSGYDSPSDLVTAEPDYPSAVETTEPEEVIIPAELGTGIGDAMGSYWKTDTSMPEAREYTRDVERPDDNTDTGERGDNHLETVEKYQLEGTNAKEIRDNREVLDYEALDRAATAELITPPRHDYRTQTARPASSTTASDIQSPITQGKAKPAWVQNLIREHGDLPLFGLIMEEIRSRQAESRKIWHERYVDLTQGLPGIMSGFGYSLPFEERRDEFFRRSRLMKEQDHRAKLMRKQEKSRNRKPR
jgi:hypothetical protein